MGRNLIIAFVAIIIIGLSGCVSRPEEAAAVNGTADEKESSSSSADYVYGIPMDETAGVITENVADVYTSPDVKSSRLTQALYNQPVCVLQQESGWARVTTVDGTTGWTKLKFVDRDISSVYGRSYTHRIIVTTRSKVVTSNPSGGITYVDAPMGTEFLSFNSSDDAFEVLLPENKTGWIKGSGIIHIGLDEKVPVTNADDFASTALRLKGASYLLNGMSELGIDAPGLVYICARINGIDLPRTTSGQLASGTEIKPDEAQAGDLVFLAGIGEGEGDSITCVGISLGGGSYIYAGRKIGYVAVGDINEVNSEGKIVAARRIFN
ncbi:MAG: NlpC/P60 family protein [Clostridiaceae bacterium]